MEAKIHANVTSISADMQKPIWKAQMQIWLKKISTCIGIGRKEAQDSMDKN